ncbi:hypothetical protein HMPREF0494_0202 [Limosilactobacillus antri DSM 16041]|uniref:Uncharacterized protein n=1 Tax=Limosilactobacillus antri DSM 16041 TaxID=525309 RepID=C8P4F8_9LACO|nr:hypothetical protein HMPREF0494_0202 [Limosilactobacillus antri DSM 16041]
MNSLLINRNDYYLQQKPSYRKADENASGRGKISETQNTQARPES